jgi:zinc transport system substrate-binding protein
MLLNYTSEFILRFASALVVLLASTTLAFAEVKVMASIKPVHSLVAQVMQGVATPGLIVDGNNSPHTYSLKPSDAEALQQAQVIFWVGQGLEAFLTKPIETLGDKAMSVSLMDVPGLTLLPVREGKDFDKDEHQGEVHTHDAADPHIWLDPENAKSMLKTIAATLSKVDAVNAKTYQTNAENAAAKIDQLSVEILPATAALKGKGFIVFHDAYHYYENRFGLSATGAIFIHPENPPGAKAIAQMKQRVAEKNVACVFAEPQFDNKLINVIIEGTTVKSTTLDPIGAQLDAGPRLYEDLLRNVTKSFVTCLR